jgi:hypothetical protein
MFKITEGQYALGGLTVFAVWLFVVLPLLHYFGACNVLESTGWVTLASTVVTAIAGGVVAAFTIILAWVGRRQIADTRILQRAYLSVEPQGIDWSDPQQVLIGQVVFKNVGKLPATEFVSVVKKIEVHDAEWKTPDLSHADLPSEKGVIPIGAEVPQGSAGITLVEVQQAQYRGNNYLYVWGTAKFKDGFGSDRYVNFCHRYPLAMKKVEPKGPGYSIPVEFARYHQHGNKSD